MTLRTSRCLVVCAACLWLSIPLVVSQATSVSVSSWNSIGTQITATFTGSGLSNNDFTCLSPSSTSSTNCQATSNNAWPDSFTATTTFTSGISTAYTGQVFYVWYKYAGTGTWSMLGQTPPNPRHAPTSVVTGSWNNIGTVISATFSGGVGVSNNDYTCLSPSSTSSSNCQFTSNNAWPDSFTATTTFTTGISTAYTGQVFYVWYGFDDGNLGIVWSMVGQTPPNPRHSATSVAVSAWSAQGTVVSGTFSGGAGLSSSDYVKLCVSSTNHNAYCYSVNPTSSDALSASASFTISTADATVGSVWYMWYGFVNGSFGAQFTMLGQTSPNPGQTTSSPTTTSPTTASPTSSPTSAAVGDPHLTGFDGIEFDFFGSHDSIYCLYASTNNELHINALIHDAIQPHRYPHMKHPSFMTRISVRYLHHYMEFGIHHLDNIINNQTVTYFPTPGYNTIYLAKSQNTYEGDWFRFMQLPDTHPNKLTHTQRVINQSIATVELTSSISIEIRIYNHTNTADTNTDYAYIIRIERQRDDFHQSYLNIYMNTNIDKSARGLLGQTLSSTTMSMYASAAGAGNDNIEPVNTGIDWFTISNQQPEKYQVNHIHGKLHTDV